MVTLTGLDVTEDADAEGLPSVARARIEPGDIDLTIEPVAFGPLVLTAEDGRVSRFPRAQVLLTTGDGRRGSGWIEWNQPAAAAGDR